MKKSYFYGIPGYPPELAIVKSQDKHIPFLKEIEHEFLDIGKLFNISFQFKNDGWPNIKTLSTKWKRWGFCHVQPELNHVYFRFPLGPLRFHLLLKDLHSASPSFVINPIYWHLSFNIGTALSPYYVHLRDIITMNLLARGYLTLHGACLCASNGEACLIVAPPETGKTITALLGQKDGYGLISEDLVVSDGNNILPSLLKGQTVYSPAYLRLQKGAKAKLQKITTQLIEKSGVAWPGLLAQLGGSIVIKPYNRTATLRYSFFLARGSKTAIIPVNHSDALTKMRIVARGEFHWRSNPVLLAYDYHTMLLHMPSILEKEDALLSSMVNKNYNCYQLEAPHPYEYINLIKNIFPF